MEDSMAHILVVDDEPDSVELLVEYLTRQGHAVSTASDGAEALRKLKEDRPHLILLDILMPGMNGIEVLRRAREIDHEVGVIMVTAVHEEELGRQALMLGAFDFITKPIDFTYLDRCLWHKITLMTL
jgi:DNA-binding response OmpR family regulator